MKIDNKKQFLSKNIGKFYDLCMSVGAVVVFNMVIQLFIYPFIADRLGNEGFGQVRAMMSLVSITAGSFGVSANYSRMMTENKLHPSNSSYFYILLGGGAACAALGIAYMTGLGAFTPLAALMFALLIILTAFRYYSDVSFRMKTDFFGYMIFYFAIAAGYAVGVLVYLVTKQWYLAFIMGELTGIIFVAVRGSVYKKALKKPDSSFPKVCKSMSFLLPSNLMENLTLNADGLVLIAFCDEEAVAIFYTASLLGKVIAMLSAPLNSLIISYIVKSGVELNKKFWSVALGAVTLLGALAFGGCSIASPIFLKIFYPSLYGEVLRYIAPAILGQIFYFISGILLVVLLKFNGEKKQFFINATYFAEFFIIVTLMTYFMGLNGFIYGTLIANAIRFIGVATLGCISVVKKGRESKI